VDDPVGTIQTGKSIDSIFRISSRTVKTEAPERLEDFGITNDQFAELMLLDEFAKLRAIVYQYDVEKVPGSDGGWHLGLIAEEVAELFPAAVTSVTLHDGTEVPVIIEDLLEKIHFATTKQLV
jgi:hypothetical protein